MLATLLVALVAIIHLAILVLEMFLWEGSAGRRAFNLSADFARQTRVLAANQGLYNGFLAAGLDSYVAKPVEIGRLLEAVAEAVSARKTAGSAGTGAGVGFAKAPAAMVRPARASSTLYFMVSPSKRGRGTAA